MADLNSLVMDDDYEFSAPKFYDFINGETEEEKRKAELWFENEINYAPSPFMQRIKSGRTIQLESLCDFTKDEELQDNARPVRPNGKEEPAVVVTSSGSKEEVRPNGNEERATVLKSSGSTEEVRPNGNEERAAVLTSSGIKETVRPSGIEECAAELSSSGNKVEVMPNEIEKPAAELASSGSKVVVMPKEIVKESGGSLPDVESVQHQSNVEEVSTPAPPMISQKSDKNTDSKKRQTAKKIASILRNPSALKTKARLQQSQLKKNSNPASARKQAITKSAVGTHNLAQENQAIKRQKLEGGKSKPNLPHKAKVGVASSSSTLFALTAEVHKQDRKMYAREPVPPFVSIAEMMKKFQSSTREMSLPPMSNSTSQDDPAGKMQRKHKLILTRPKEPEFVTAQRVRPTRVKSSAELEEEMMAKIPKFKARPLNKKILEVPTLPALPKSTPQLPEFKEFHLQTMARANQNAETSTVASIESTQSHQWKSLHLTAPTSPVLKTSLRGRPPRIRSSKEMEKEELEKVPKFKARPLNKKIFESKGDLGMFCNTKRQVTVPQEFHFATDERILPPANVADELLFGKLPLNSESQNDKTIPRNTTPNPFRLSTEERGAEKERKLFTELLHKQIEEEKSRIRKANPYPYTTDYPVIPPKPEPKKCTKPEPFQLESLVKHEQETWRHMEERCRMEEEEAKMRNFKAQPVLTEDPIPVPEKVRKPLTEVQDFKLRVDNRSLDRAEFDKKIKQKEMMHKRYREETESARMIEEEKALKQLRRTLVPHARPVPKFDHPFLPQKYVFQTSDETKITKATDC
ncbi:hypothetical protein P3L10_027248 [Capsicum annuum]